MDRIVVARTSGSKDVDAIITLNSFMKQKGIYIMSESYVTQQTRTRISNDSVWPLRAASGLTFYEDKILREKKNKKSNKKLELISS